MLVGTEYKNFTYGKASIWKTDSRVFEIRKDSDNNAILTVIDSYGGLGEVITSTLNLESLTGLIDFLWDLKHEIEVSIRILEGKEVSIV